MLFLPSDPCEASCFLLTLVSQGLVLEQLAPLDPEADLPEPPVPPAAFAEAS